MRGEHNLARTSFLGLIIKPVVARDPNEHHRTATPLELLFDLVLVIAVAAAAGGLHHALNEHHFADGIFIYLFLFWTLWWPWMNFTWYASAYDNDDALYRVLILVQMAGALVTTVGIREMTDGSVSPLGLAGYIIMRISMIALWLRAAKGSKNRAPMRYAFGIFVCQLVWIAYFFLAPRETFLLFALPILVLEMLVPAWAERAGETPWHRHHIIERYGLLTIIVLGESLTAGASAIAAIEIDGGRTPELLATLIGCFVILFAMWWIYFGERKHAALDTFGTSLLWGYLHYFIFASIAATGAGISVLVDQLSHKSELSYDLACAAVSVPVAVYLMVVWLVHDRLSGDHKIWQLPLFALLCLASTFLPYTAETIAVLLIVLVALRTREDVAT